MTKLGKNYKQMLTIVPRAWKREKEREPREQEQKSDECDKVYGESVRLKKNTRKRKRKQEAGYNKAKNAQIEAVVPLVFAVVVDKENRNGRLSIARMRMTTMMRMRMMRIMSHRLWLLLPFISNSSKQQSESVAFSSALDPGHGWRTRARAGSVNLCNINATGFLGFVILVNRGRTRTWKGSSDGTIKRELERGWRLCKLCKESTTSSSLCSSPSPG